MIGGQAVIEGVMFRSARSLVVAVRTPGGEISVRGERIRPLRHRFPPLRKPFLRGIAVLIESIHLGTKALIASAEEASGGEAKGGSGSIALALLMSALLGVGLFIALPAFLAGKLAQGGWTFNLLDGLIRLAIFLAYIAFISTMPDIRRVFQYHGAEHKSINAYEAGDELTEERVMGYSTLHPRCGTSFILTVLVLSILIFSLAGRPESMAVRIGSRLALIPVVAGLSYEIIGFASKHRGNKLVDLAVAPGLLLQRLTTREPSRDQVRVALAALKELLSMEGER